MSEVVIDTNVLRVANGRSDHASMQCVANCARRLQEALERDTVCADEEREIFAEYRRHASMSGQPGPGDRFLQWFFRHIASERVRRHPTGGGPGVRERLPLEFSGMDRADAKFLSVYLGCGAEELLNATDSDWAELAPALDAYRVRVVERCGLRDQRRRSA